MVSIMMPDRASKRKWLRYDIYKVCLFNRVVMLILHLSMYNIWCRAWHRFVLVLVIWTTHWCRTWHQNYNKQRIKWRQTWHQKRCQAGQQIILGHCDFHCLNLFLWFVWLVASQWIYACNSWVININKYKSFHPFTYWHQTWFQSRRHT